MNKTFCALVVALFLLSGIARSQTGGQDIVIGKKHTFFSKILSEERTFSVYLPRGYDHANAKYPLLLALDGYFLWTISTVDYLSFAGDIPQMVVLAIDSTDRDRDFTPTNSKNLEGEEVPSSGGAKNFLRFLETELIPHLESRYRLEPFRLLAGHSMGGLFVSYALLENPGLFQAYLAMSPTLPWDSDWLIRQMESKLPGQYPRQIFYQLGMDNQGGPMLDSAQAFMAMLKQKSPGKLEYGFTRYEHESHISCYQIALYHALKAIYAPYKLPGEIIEAGDATGIERHYRNLTERYGYRSRPSWEWLYFIGHWHELMNRLPQAMAIFELGARYYPANADVHYSLALVYEKSGLLEKAKNSLETALGCSSDPEEKKKLAAGMEQLKEKMK